MATLTNENPILPTNKLPKVPSQFWGAGSTTGIGNIGRGKKLEHLTNSRLLLAKYQSLVPLFQIIYMARNTSILLGEHFENFISTEVSSGRYNSASEVIRTALRMLEAEEQKKKALINALIEGESSGFVKNFDPKSHLNKLHKKFL